MKDPLREAIVMRDPGRFEAAWSGFGEEERQEALHADDDALFRCALLSCIIRTDSNDFSMPNWLWEKAEEDPVAQQKMLCAANYESFRYAFSVPHEAAARWMLHKADSVTKAALVSQNDYGNLKIAFFRETLGMAQLFLENAATETRQAMIRYNAYELVKNAVYVQNRPAFDCLYNYADDEVKGEMYQLLKERVRTWSKLYSEEGQVGPLTDWLGIYRDPMVHPPAGSPGSRVFGGRTFSGADKMVVAAGRRR